MRRIIAIIALSTLLLLIAGTALAQDALIIYGDNLSFKVSEPPNWRGHTDDAGRYRLNAYFSLPGYDFNSSPAVMYIRVMKKGGLTVQKRLEADMADFAKRKQSIEFSDFAVENVNYQYAAKQYFINSTSIDYLCYIDPGESSPLYVIFVLSGPKELSGTYLADFKKLIQSFTWLN